jgi:DNA-binding MarR family transcriptional regulator
MLSEASAVDRLLGLLDRLRRLRLGQHPLGVGSISPPQLALLDWIARSPGSRLGEVASGLGLTPPTVSVGLRRLERAGLVERLPDPQDRRAVRFFLTPEGKRLCRRAHRFRRRKAQLLLASLTPQEQEVLLNLLDKAIRGAEMEIGHHQDEGRSAFSGG